MKATETQFLRLLEGKKQFIIPIYQRMYSWTAKQCDQLWDDIERVAQDDSIPGHFIGSIVYIEKGLYQAVAIPQLLVIDGQQRLTTLSLLLAALGDTISTNEKDFEISRESIRDDYLFNKHGKDELKYKLLLTRSDKNTLTRILDGLEPTSPVSNRVVENYQFFKEKIEKSKIDLMKIYRGISKLLIVDISLDRQHDNAQLIFESLNSTGLELSQADLIRNFVLMGLEPKDQDSLYSDYWFPMEQSFGQTDYVKQFDRYMRDYLTVKTGAIPNINAVYDAFKTYSRLKESGSIEEIVADIYQYSKYFTRWALGKEDDRVLSDTVSDINTLKVDVAYPFLLELYDDYENERLGRAELLEILRYIESYVFRRAVCGIPTNSLNKTFATLGRELKMNNYLESFKAALLLKDSYRRFPSDDEFARELMAKDLYNFRNRNYWLRKFENYGRKERVEVEDYTIEHIMPQNENLSEQWKEDLGENWKEVHDQYLHTIGNLTLTGYNTELSDRPFLEKRDMEGGFTNSPLRLNKALATLDVWNKDEIKKRARTLSDHAKQVWSMPSVPAETLQKYRKVESQENKEYELDEFEYFEDGMRELFMMLRKRVLNLDPSVSITVRKYIIKFSTTTSFVDVTPKKSFLKLHLNMPYTEILDPKDMCEDASGKHHYGTGDVRVKLSDSAQLDDVMALVHQSFDMHMDNGNDQ